MHKKTEGMHKKTQDKHLTLTDADISSQRNVSRRAMLTTLGKGIGAAAVAIVVGRPGSAAAQRPGGGCTDNDRGANEDPPGRGRRCSGRPTGCTDTDQGSNEDPPGYGRGCWI
jgi:hypothetical protein